MDPAKWMIVIVLGIYAGEWFIYHIVCEPVLGWAILFNCFLALAVWSYLATALTDPGTPDCMEWQAWSSLRAREPGLRASGDEAEAAARGWAPGVVTWCQKCQRERPERAHHCSSCGTCILRMDHHCPWIGGCVGWRNHKYFLLLNWWSFWTSLAFILTIRGPSMVEAINLVGSLTRRFSMVPAVGMLNAVLFLLITGGMFFSSLVMGARNITAIEELFHGENPYCLSCLDNLRQLLGPVDLRILVPLPPLNRPTGTAFPVSRPEKASVAGPEEGAGGSPAASFGSQAAGPASKYGSV
mmetsp:Transcript_42270/g.117704  ORF Transcript_42270/g.117704 Transcript_42270/m.117704 type:complete len:298 (-) Transcript_42270:59-952(-)